MILGNVFQYISEEVIQVPPESEGPQGLEDRTVPGTPDGKHQESEYLWYQRLYSTDGTETGQLVCPAYLDIEGPTDVYFDLALESLCLGGTDSAANAGIILDTLKDSFLVHSMNFLAGVLVSIPEGMGASVVPMMRHEVSRDADQGDDFPFLLS